MSDTFDEKAFKKKAFSNNASYYNKSTPSPVSEEELKAAYELIEKYNAHVVQNNSETLLRCGECGGTQAIKDSVFVQTYWYTEPHGCTGGDHWNSGEGQVECHSCGVRMRLNFECKNLQEYDKKELFKKVEKCYD